MRTYEGFRVTEKYLVVGFVTGQGTTVRFAEVRVPLEELAASESLADGLDRWVRRTLVEKWSGLKIAEDPLF